MSIRKKILISMASVAIACAAIIGMLGVVVVRLFVDDFNDEQLSIAYTLAETVIEDYKADAERTSSTVAQDDRLVNELQQYLAGGVRHSLADISASLMEAANVDSLTVLDMDGTVLVRAGEPGYYGDSLAYQSNVKNALQGKRYTTIEAGTVIKLSVICGAPVFDQHNNQIGVVSVGYRLDQSDFVDYVKHLANTEVTICLGDTRVSTTLVSEQGGRAVDTQVSPDISKHVLRGEEYKGQAVVPGKTLLAHYSPLRDAEGSVIGMLFVGLDTSANDTRMIQDTLIMMGVVASLGLLSALVSWKISSKLSHPIMEISDRAKQLAMGDVDIELSIATDPNSKDEVTILANEFQEMLKAINNQADILSTIAQGDYSVSIPVRSEHDIINQAINRLIDRNNDLLAEISVSSGQVFEGSKQIAGGAQALAQGAVEQASSIEELSASINDIAEQTKQNATIAKKAAELSAAIKSNAEKGSEQMGQMMQAVREINDASNQISKVIQVIDSIALQTKILALNAAMEAARAGQYGKGFAVVAAEVRSLADKSAEAAKDTEGLIENTIVKADYGLNIASETSASLEEIVRGIGHNAEIVANIAQSSDEQADAIAQINTGIEQVAQVVQLNSAAAEESAAASEEMSGQSDMLTHLITQFKLKEAEDSHSLLLEPGMK